jgi:ketosteroid isomerase-like protein
MAKFDMEQTMAIAAVQQLINDWAYDLDFHDNDNIGGLVTDDISYNVGGAVRQGRAAVEAFYTARRETLDATGTPRPVMRHVNTNFRTSFVSANEVLVTFSLVYWTTETPELNPTDVVAVADVWMTCRRGSDGDWKIAKFDSTRSLTRLR